MKQFATLAVVLSCAAPAAVSEAHSGGLDSNCGHAGSRPYHFHLDGACGERLRAQLARVRDARERSRGRRDDAARPDAPGVGRRQPPRERPRPRAGGGPAGRDPQPAALPVVEDGATYLSDPWLLARHGRWVSGTDEDARGVIAVSEDGLRLEVHCSPGDDEGGPEHAKWLAAVISDAGDKYFVSGPPGDRRAALLLGTGARMIAQAAARGRQPLEIQLGNGRKTFPTAGADRAAARALPSGTACDWASDTDLTFDAPSTEGLRGGGMALAGGGAAAPSGRPGRPWLNDAALEVLGFAMVYGGFLVGVVWVCILWRERVAKRQLPLPLAGVVRQAALPRGANRPKPSPAPLRPRPAPPPPASVPASPPAVQVRRGVGCAGRKAAQWAALQRARWRCQLCGRAGILEVYQAGGEMDGGWYALENLFALCRSCQPRRGELMPRGGAPAPFAPSAEATPRFEDVSGRTVAIDLDQLDTVSRGGGHGARTTVRYKPRRGGACFLLTSGYPFVCREIDRALVARNRPRLVDWKPAEPPGECLPPGDWEGGAR